MSFNIQKVILRTLPGEIRFPDGSTLNFRYRPHAYTPDHEDRVEEARAEAGAGTTLKAMLIPLLESWDVVDEVPKTDSKGEPVLKGGEPVMEEAPVKIDMEGLGKVPIQALNMVLEFIVNEMSPGKQSAETSEGTFA